MLIAFDLEGTLVCGELLPALGERLGCSALASLTAQGMSGDISFEESLSRRISLIEGTPISVVEEVASTLTMIDGAGETIRSLRESGWSTAIISGGFSTITWPIAERLGVDYVYCNRFRVSDGRVSGVQKPVLNGEMKRDLFVSLASSLEFDLGDCVAVGDGANDIPMIDAAGRGIALNAKPRVRVAADVVFDTQDLRDIIPVLSEFREERLACRERCLSCPTVFSSTLDQEAVTASSRFI